MKSLASHPHYRDHLAPIMARLPDDDDGVVVVAGYGDVVWAKQQGYRRIVLAQHGAGQSYGTDHAHYPGGAHNEAVGLFLVPNHHAAGRWRAKYPDARVEVVGTPLLDDLPRRHVRPYPVVAFAFHWDLYLVPETRSAIGAFWPALRDIAQRFPTIGTGHPRQRKLARIYRDADIEYVPDFHEVCRRADVLVFDNTSAGYEFASTGRPVVVMDAPWYRRDVDFGLRFWDAADVGVRVDSAPALAPAIERALELRTDDVERREEALDVVYAYRTGAAQRAADAIMEWAA